MSTKSLRWIGLFAVLAILTALGSHAASLDGGTQRNFRFYFSVKGYDRNGWFDEPSALALDERSGLIYIADKKTGTVDAFSLQGVGKFQYGAKNGLKAPIGLAVDPKGNLYVTENEGGPIKIINSKGEVDTLDLPADEGHDNETPKPGRMTFDRDGNLYIVDRANSRIFVFDKERKFKFKFGRIGDKRGEFKLLQDVAVDKQGRIYATDALGVPVQVFDRKGGYIYRFGLRGEGSEMLSFPTGLFVDRHDQIWVVDKTQHCLRVYDRSGASLATFGAYGQGEGTLFYPISVTSDSFGRVYVLEVGARRLQVFSLSRPFEPFGQ
ncbi:MAG: NHL repeat-containing protein [Armatimonadota bacterium]